MPKGDDDPDGSKMLDRAGFGDPTYAAREARREAAGASVRPEQPHVLEEGAGLPAYSGLKSLCVKCGWEYSADTLYVAEEYPPPSTRPLCERIPEHLRRTCQNCGYAWVEACKEPLQGAP